MTSGRRFYSRNVIRMRYCVGRLAWGVKSRALPLCLYRKYSISDHDWVPKSARGLESRISEQFTKQPSKGHEWTAKSSRIQIQEPASNAQKPIYRMLFLSKTPTRITTPGALTKGNHGRQYQQRNHEPLAFEQSRFEQQRRLGPRAHICNSFILRGRMDYR